MVWPASYWSMSVLFGVQVSKALETFPFLTWSTCLHENPSAFPDDTKVALSFKQLLCKHIHCSPSLVTRQRSFLELVLVEKMFVMISTAAGAGVFFCCLGTYFPPRYAPHSHCSGLHLFAYWCWQIGQVPLPLRHDDYLQISTSYDEDVDFSTMAFLQRTFIILRLIDDLQLFNINRWALIHEFV